MSPVVRLLSTAAIRLGLLFYAGWFAFHDAPLGSEDIPAVDPVAAEKSSSTDWEVPIISEEALDKLTTMFTIYPM